MGVYSVYCALCAGPLSAHRAYIDSSDEDKLRFRDTYIRKERAQRKGNKEPQTEEVAEIKEITKVEEATKLKEASELDEDSQSEEEEELEEEDLEDYDPRLVNGENTKWLSSLLAVGCLPELPDGEK